MEGNLLKGVDTIVSLYKEIEEARERLELIEPIKMGDLLKILEKQNSIL